VILCDVIHKRTTESEAARLKYLAHFKTVFMGWILSL